MLNEIQTKKIEALLADEAVFEKIQACTSDEEIYGVLAENGVECTFEEFAAYMAHCRQVMVEKGIVSEDGELSAEALEAVSGGSKRGRTLLLLAGMFALSCGAYAVGGVCIVLACLH